MKTQIRSQTELSTMPWFADFKEPVSKARSEWSHFVLMELDDQEEYRHHESRRWQTSYGNCCYYFPFWAAQALGYSVDAPQVVDAAIGNFFLYHYYTIRDDAIDDHTLGAELAAFGGDITLARSLSLLGKTGIKTELLLGEFARLLTLAIRAEKALRTTDRSGPGLQERISLSGQKAALAKLAVSALAVSTLQRKELNHVEAVMDDVAVALQLVDDLTDWRHDYQAAQYSPPVLLALEYLNQGGEASEPGSCWRSDIQRGDSW